MNHQTRNKTDSHTHDWEPEKFLKPILEDGAAIYLEECLHQPMQEVGTCDERDETYYRATGPRCGEIRRTRLEPWEIIRKYPHTPNIKILSSMLDPVAESVEGVVENATRVIEQDHEIVDEKPKEYVVAENDLFKIIYK